MHAHDWTLCIILSIVILKYAEYFEELAVITQPVSRTF